jgi:hypothetical protein
MWSTNKNIEKKNKGKMSKTAVSHIPQFGDMDVSAGNAHL